MVLPFEEILNVRDQCWVLVEVSLHHQKGGYPTYKI